MLAFLPHRHEQLLIFEETNALIKHQKPSSSVKSNLQLFFLDFTCERFALPSFSHRLK